MVRAGAEITNHNTEITELEDGLFWFKRVTIAADEDSVKELLFHRFQTK